MPDVVWQSVARIIRTFLIERGVGVAYDSNTDWAIATANMPAKPFSCITIYDEGAIKRDRTHRKSVVQDPVVLIEVRSTEHSEGQYKAKKILEAMDGLWRWTWTGGENNYDQTVLFQTARRTREIFYLGKDENGRHRFNLEYALVVQSITDTS